MKDMFADMIERLLAETVTPETIVAAEDGAWPQHVWQPLEEHGVLIAAVPEAQGGVGASWHDAYELVRAAGRHAAPVPLAETILVNWLIGLAGAMPPSGPLTLGPVRDRAFAGNGFTGSVVDVPWGATAHAVLIADAEDRAVLLTCADAAVTEERNVAREPRATLRFVDAIPIATLVLPADAAEMIRLGGASIRAAQIAGGLERVLAIAVDYANQRVQFGRQIGKFQAIQHQIAVLAQHAAMAAASAEAAFATAGDAGPQRFAVATAKAVASEAAGQGASIAHGVLGAIGFTYEHALHLTTRRLWSWRSEFGSQADWSRWLGEHACRAGGDGLWRTITGVDVAAA